MELQKILIMLFMVQKSSDQYLLGRLVVNIKPVKAMFFLFVLHFFFPILSVVHFFHHRIV